MIYDFRKGKSAIYISSLLYVDYDYDLDEFILSQNELEFDEIGFHQKTKKNGFVRLGAYLPEYSNVRFGRHPALHIFNCDTTDDLSRKMKVCKSSKNTYFSKDQKKHITTNLEICKDCARRLRKRYNLNLGTNTFNNFVLALEESEKKQTVIDRKGYILNWQQVSYCYRDTKNFTCERCGFKATSDTERKYLHTHHRNHDKKNNNRSNLECLCVECHSNVDEYHKEKFSFEGLKPLTDFLTFKEQKKHKSKNTQ